MSSPEVIMLPARRLKREMRTITAMVHIYCRDDHLPVKEGICDDCSAFLHYAEKRLSRCPFQAQKPTCGKCPIHCYQKQMQDKARQIMRYSGPKMIWTHPVLAFCHILDGLRKAPGPSSCRQSGNKRQKR